MTGCFNRISSFVLSQFLAPPTPHTLQSFMGDDFTVEIPCFLLPEQRVFNFGSAVGALLPDFSISK